MGYTEHDRVDSDPHHCRALLIDDESLWIEGLGTRYRELRSQTALPPIDILLDGVTVIDATEITRRVAAAQLPTTTTPRAIDVVRSDIGELTAYDLIASEYEATVVAYPIADRELPQMPARGLDAVAVSNQGPLVVYIVEVKVSTDSDSPPSVVEAADDSLWNQHSTHVENTRVTINKFWAAYARSREPIARERLGASIVYLEAGDNTRVTLVAFSCMVRPQPMYATSDFGPFASKPGDLSPATSYFAIVLFNGTLNDIRTAVLTKAQEGTE